MIKVLTSLRFFAILAIFLHHLEYPYGLGAIGVSFFFILSGFILTLNYRQRFETLSFKDYRDFLTARFGRTYPLYLLTFLISVPLMTYYSMSPAFYYDAILNIFMVQTYAPIGIHVFSFNGLAWAISDLMFFYVLFPFIIFVLAKFGLFSNPFKILLIWCVSFGIPAAITLTLRQPAEGTNTSWWLIYIFPPVRIFNFLAGICSCALFLWIRDRVSVPRHGLLIFTTFELISLGLFVLSFQSKLQTLFPYGLYCIPSLTIILFVFAFQKGAISRLLSHNIFVHLGDISFAIYMVHQLAINYVFLLFTYDIFGMDFSKLGHTAAQIAVFIAVLAISDVLYRYFETPIRSFIRNFRKRDSPISSTGL